MDDLAEAQRLLAFHQEQADIHRGNSTRAAEAAKEHRKHAAAHGKRADEHDAAVRERKAQVHELSKGRS